MPADTVPSSPDPTLDALVPRTTWRAAVAVALAVGVLVAAGVVGAWSRVSLTTSGGGSSLLPDRQVEVVSDVVPRGGPGLALVDLTPPVGARVVHVWAVPGGELPSGDLGQGGAVRAAEASGVRDSLPVRLSPGQHYQLVVLLEITDCVAYAVTEEGQGPFSGPDPHATEAHLRTSVGTRAEVPLVPSVMWTADDLARYSGCTGTR